jgi:plastocyanin
VGVSIIKKAERNLITLLKIRSLTMMRKSLITIIAILIGVFYLTRLTIAAEEKTEEIKLINKVVVISTSEGVKPSSLNSKLGTTVIWVNHSRTPQEILFLDKKVVLACGSPVNFFVGKDGAYESAKIPFGGTASLCFTEKGKYEYIVRPSSKGVRDYLSRERKKRDHRGIIWIK